jgi:peptide/nickel transport system substrate-binding protein
MSCPWSAGRGARGWFHPYLALVLGGVLTLSSACRHGSTPEPPPPVRVAIGLTATETGINSLIRLLKEESLARVGPDGRPQAVLAEHWVVSGDRLSWRFHLRPGLQFQNGAPLDASNVVAGLRRSLDGGGNVGALRDVTSVEAVGPLDFVIHTRRPSSILIDALCSNISINALDGSATGSFRLISTDKESAHLEAFTGDARTPSSVDQVDVRLYPSGRNAWSAMMRGDIDVLYDVSPEALEFVEQSSQMQLKSFLKPFVYMLGFNLRHPLLRSREVRQALNAAVNRDDIVKTVFRGHGMAAKGPIWPRYWTYDEQLAPFRYAPTEAQKLLENAGLPMQRSTDQHMPSRLRFTCLVPTGDRYERMGLMLQRQLADAGIDMQLEPVPMRSLLTRLQTGQYDAFLFETAAASLGWTYAFWHSPEPPSPVLVDHGYTGANAALDQVLVARNDDDLRAASSKLQRVMMDDPPAVFICWRETARAVSTRFALPVLNDRDVMKTLPQWQLLAPPGGSLPMPTSTATVP